MFDLTYDDILRAWETYPTRRVRYADGETGWVKQLTPAVYCVANVPLAPDLHLYDLVTLDSQPDDFDLVDAVLRSHFTTKWVIRYAQAPTKADTLTRFRHLCQRIREVGGHLEGLCPGLGLCEVPAGLDMSALLGTITIPGLTGEPYANDHHP